MSLPATSLDEGGEALANKVIKVLLGDASARVGNKTLQDLGAVALAVVHHEIEGSVLLHGSAVLIEHCMVEWQLGSYHNTATKGVAPLNSVLSFHGQFLQEGITSSVSWMRGNDNRWSCLRL